MSEQSKGSKFFFLLAGLCGIVAFYIVTNFTPASIFLEVLVAISVFGTLYFSLSTFTVKKTALAFSSGIIFLLILNRLGSLDLLTFTLSFLIVIGIFLV